MDCRAFGVSFQQAVAFLQGEPVKEKNEDQQWQHDLMGCVLEFGKAIAKAKA
jgi:hypothetical protein